MYTNAELKTNIATLLQRGGDTNYLTKIQQWVNYAQDFAFRAYDYYAELEDKYTFNTVANQESYYMPSSFDKPNRVYDYTNNRKYQIWTEESYTDSNLSNISGLKTGTSGFARMYGISAINTVIGASGITVKAKSSSAADTTGTMIRVEGYIDSAQTLIAYDTITISSSSPTSFVAGASGLTFYKITRISKSGDTTGYITVADASSNTIALMGPTDRASRYPIMNLGIIPAGVYAIHLLFKRRVSKLVNDNDYPFIDADEFFIDYGVAYGLMESKETLERSTTMFSKAKDCLNEVIRNEQTRLGEDFQHKIVTKFSQSHRV